MSDISWREWGEEAFAEARRLDRPILLDIGAVWCHWCHVMDHGISGDPLHTGTYKDPTVIALINRSYVPIKVDNDRRPDINARYNMGGWPTTAFLTPKGDPLYGATYVTPDQMISLLESIADYYQTNKEDIQEKLEQHAVQQKTLLMPSPVVGELNSSVGDFIESEIKKNFDPAFGGFGTQPKFPHPDALTFVLERYAKTSDSQLRIIAEKTLSEMSSGGMYDQYAGGFFRYSTTRDWSIPHFEKMLEDNCRLLTVNLLASIVLEDTSFRDVALDVKRFLMDVLYDPTNGSFAGSQDADREEEYYGRPLSERELLSTPFIDWTVYADWNALAISAFVQLYRIVGDKESLNVAIRLYDFLAARVSPYHYFAGNKADGLRDQLTDIEALIGAGLDLYEAAGGRRFLNEARGLADTAISLLFSEKSLLFSDIPPGGDMLGAMNAERFDQEDNAHMATQFVRLSSHTGAARYRNLAESILTALAAGYREQSYFSSGFASAVSSFLSPPVHIILVGDLASSDMEALKSAAYKVWIPSKTVELRSAEDSGEYLPDADNRPVAYVCIGTACSNPVVDPDELKGLLIRQKRT